MKYLPGVGFGVASGSIGGTTYSRNRFGPYTRIKAQPVNPNTARQQAVRNAFSNLAFVWINTLTPVQRAAWNLYATSVSIKDALGQDIFISGFNMFIRSNSITVGGAVPRVDSGPTIFSLANTDPTMIGTVSEATQLISVAFDTALTWVGEDDALMQIQMTAPVSPGREYIQVRTRIAGYILGDSGLPPTSPQTFTAPFAVVANQRVIVQARILRADGRLSDPFQDDSTITA